MPATQKSSESDSYSKIGHGFSNKVVQKLKGINKLFLQKYYFSLKKKSDKFGWFLTLKIHYLAQKPCFSGPKQLARQKVKNHYNSYDFSTL